MKWSLKIGRLFGIDLYVHFTFLLFLAFVGFSGWATGKNLGTALFGVLFLLALFGCVLMHEYGHALAARRYGIRTHDITLLPIGGLARLEKMPDKPVQELWVAVAGPAVNVVIAAGLTIGLVLSGHWSGVGLFSLGGGMMEQLLRVNIMLVVFNMLPAFPMDGGRVLRALLAMRMNYSKATQIAATVGQGMAIIFGFVGLFTNPMLLFIALFVWIGASQEASATQVKNTLDGARVRDAMLTEFRILAPDSRLADAARMLLAGSQQDFPVLQEGRLVGMLPRGQLIKGLREAGELAPVVSVMSHEVEVLNPDEDLETALSGTRSEKGGAMAVVDQGRIVGLLTAENIGEFMMIRSALGGKGRNPMPPVLPRQRVPPVIVSSERAA